MDVKASVIMIKRGFLCAHAYNHLTFCYEPVVINHNVVHYWNIASYVKVPHSLQSNTDEWYSQHSIIL